MPSLEELDAALKRALKARDQAALRALRMLKAAVHNEEIALGRPLGEEEFVRVVRREIKKREEAAAQYEKGGRADLASSERAEIEVLRAFLPAELSEEELRRGIEAIIQERGLQGPKAMGEVMQAVRERFGARADMRKAAEIARALLS
ncbi:MAG: GatB/YqeY domain-containing protein [Zetaproteobacteria bacterium]|nr:MAG: GatB/YqeY domain-containing protein [Zetaproteobacteria bacterium]